MHKKTIKTIGATLLATFFLTGCSSFWEKDNTPEPSSLAQFTPTIQPRLLWSASIGNGTNDEYLKIRPVINGNLIVTSSVNGLVTAIDKDNGHIVWQKNIRKRLINGPGAGNGIIVVASPEGQLTALNSQNGNLAWQSSIQGEPLAAPAISHGRVIIKAVDGSVYALSSQTGKKQWHFQQVEPNFVLRAASNPVTYKDDVLLGFANGNLAKLTLDDGRLLWTKALASPKGTFAIQRMIDIDATPVIYKRHIYAASYQGNIAAMDWYTGNTVWSNSFSSYTGISAANQKIFASDTKSYLWAFNRLNGNTEWKLTKLAWRNISGPAVVSGHVVVGDSQGFLHWLNTRNGQFSARTYAGGAIYSTPLSRNGVVYAQTSKGRLVAYTLT